jgi:hypothetical protein
LFLPARQKKAVRGASAIVPVALARGEHKRVPRRPEHSRAARREGRSAQSGGGYEESQVPEEKKKAKVFN